MLTQLEKKLFNEGFIDENGNIQKGPFKDTYSINEIEKKGPAGETILLVMANYSMTKEFPYFEITLSKEEIDSIMHTKNLMQIILNQKALRQACCNPIFMEIRDRVTKTEKEIFIAEDEKTGGRLSENKLEGIKRTSFANSYMHYAPSNIPQEAYKTMNDMPKSFWEDPMVITEFQSYFFGSLDMISRQFDTPEGIVAFRAYANEVGNNCIGIIGKSLEKSSDDRLLGAMLDFDTKMHQKENKASGLTPHGGDGK